MNRFGLAGIFPQHVTEPSVRSPQVCQVPALTALKEPAGASAWPFRLSPQHSTVLSAFTQHVWYRPNAQCDMDRRLVT